MYLLSLPSSKLLDSYDTNTRFLTRGSLDYVSRIKKSFRLNATRMMKRAFLLSLALLVTLASASHGTPPSEQNYQDFTRVNHIETDDFRALDRFENSGFSNYSTDGYKKADFQSWEENHGSTHHIGVSEGEWSIDGPTVRTRWVSNGFGATASISQDVNLTGVDSIKLDATGTKGNSHRSEIVLEIDGTKAGTFIKSPQSERAYDSVGVDLTDRYQGNHEVTIKWVQVMGDNIGNSGIDDVEALASKNPDFEPNNTLTRESRIYQYAAGTQTSAREGNDFESLGGGEVKTTSPSSLERTVLLAMRTLFL
jgi:hypothetical protein